MRTKEEQIKYFEWLAEEYATDAAREEDKMKVRSCIPGTSGFDSGLRH